jgi:hypothetical protein
VNDQKDPRALIAEGREVDGKMTTGPWMSRHGIRTADVYADRFPSTDRTLLARVNNHRDDATDQEHANAGGIAWMRNNLRALLDGYASALIERDEAKAWIARTVPEYEATIQARRIAEIEVDRLNGLINTPRTDDFFAAVRAEAAHQIERWGVEHDAGKRPEDWVTLVVYLLGKASTAHFAGDVEKLKHHVVTVAAVCLNWLRNLNGESDAMRPGIGPQVAGR